MKAPDPIRRSLSPLPVDAVLPQLVSSLQNFPAAVLVAPPGSGKTTRVAPALLQSQFLKQPHASVILLQPRRLAARAAATRICQERGAELGGDYAGFQIRFEKRLSFKTRIQVLTEGILNRRILADPSLPGCGCVILDEFHERSIYTDVAIAMLREIQAALRPDLRIIVMSATMDPDPVSSFLGGAPVFRSEQRSYPVEIQYSDKSDLSFSWKSASSAIHSCLSQRSGSGDILVFLPGISEIRRTESALGPVDADVHILHSSIDPKDQQRALAPSNRRKIILSTNIAETSLTIEGVATVIDAGLVRLQLNDPRLGIDRMETQRVSRASADQRAGRAGRTGPGTCHRLWSREEQSGLVDSVSPEIRRIDLSSTVLSLAAYGVTRPDQFTWFDAPPAENLERASKLLQILGLTDDSGQLTDKGKRVIRFPVHPRLGCLLVAGEEGGLGSEAAAMVAFLSERELLERTSGQRWVETRYEHSSDLLERMESFMNAGATGDPFLFHRHRQLASDYERLLSRSSCRRGKMNFHESGPLRKLLLHAYPDRVTLRREEDSTRGLMVGGRGIVLEPSSGVRKAKWFLSLDPRDLESQTAGESKVSLASEIALDWLSETHPQLIMNRTASRFDEDRNRMRSFEQKVYLDLVIHEQGTSQGVAESRSGQAMFEHLRRKPAEVFEKDEAAAQWLLRKAFLGKHMPELGFPEFGEETLLKALRFACTEAGAGDSMPRSQALTAGLETILSPVQRSGLRTNAPTQILLASGRRARVNYDSHHTASISLRLHELFGTAEVPRVAGGRVPIRIHLLGPNHRPVQITSDLKSFWTNTYPAVRRELRIRYPKMTWPENPMQAEPYNPRKGKKR